MAEKIEKKDKKSGKKRQIQAKIEAKAAEKAAKLAEMRKKLYNSRRIFAAIGIFLAYLIIMFIMKAFHYGPMLKEPEYRQIGGDNAILEIYEFTDLACPACAMANEEIHQVLNAYGDKVRIHFRHFPLDMHKHARRAALYADCAGEQGKFFQYADMLFKNQDDWEDSNDESVVFVAYAYKLGLDMEKMRSCLANPENMRRIELEKAEGRAKGVDVTPSFIINGKFRKGAGSITYFAQKLDIRLRKEKENGK